MSSESEKAPHYLKDFIEYQRSCLIEYAIVKGVIVHFDVNDDTTNEDLIRMISGALWQRHEGF